jgi:hypothetical protein
MNRYRDRIRRGVYARRYVAPVEGGDDTTPDPFAFVDVGDADPSTLYTSNVVTIDGINTPSPTALSMSGGIGEYSKNGGSWTGSLGSVVNGDTIQLRLTSAAGAGAAVAATLTIGDFSTTWTVTTSGGGQLDFSNPAQSGFIPL